MPGGSVPSATSDGCPPNPGHTYHLPGLLKLGVEALQLPGHLPRRLEGPTGPGEGASAVGAAGRAVVSRAELTRAGSWGAGGLPGAPAELWREGGIREGTHSSSTTSPIPHPGNKQPDISMATGHQKLVSLATAEHTHEGPTVRMGWGAGWVHVALTGNGAAAGACHAGAGLRAVGLHAVTHLVDGGCQVRQGSHAQLQGCELRATGSPSSYLLPQPLCLSPAVPELEKPAGAVGGLPGGLGRPLVGCSQHPEGSCGERGEKLSGPWTRRPGAGTQEGRRGVRR